MPISEVEREAMDDIIADTHATKYNWFTCHLLRLIAKADFENRQKLRLAYPDEVKAFEQWYIRGFHKKGKRDEAVDDILMEIDRKEKKEREEENKK
jgi:hypothetical protein